MCKYLCMCFGLFLVKNLCNDLFCSLGCVFVSWLMFFSNSHFQFLFEWRVTQTLNLKYDVMSMCWNGDGTRLLLGGASLTLWEVSVKVNIIIEDEEEEEDGSDEHGEGEWVKKGGHSGIREEPVLEEKLEKLWYCKMADPIIHLKFSPSGNFFAACGQVSVCVLCVCVCACMCVCVRVCETINRWVMICMR